MTLALEALARDLAGTLVLSRGVVGDPASRAAAAYERFAAPATSSGVGWAPSGRERRQLAQGLLRATARPGSAALYAEAWSEGLHAFWLTPPVPFGLGAAETFPGQETLRQSIVAVFSGRSADVTMVSLALARALDAATRTVHVRHPNTTLTPLV